MFPWGIVLQNTKIWFHKAMLGWQKDWQGGKKERTLAQYLHLKSSFFSVTVLRQLVMTSYAVNCLTKFRFTNVWSPSELAVSSLVLQSKAWDEIFSSDIHSHTGELFYFLSIFCTDILHYFTALHNIMGNCMVVTCNHILNGIYTAGMNVFGQ